MNLRLASLVLVSFLVPGANLLAASDLFAAHETLSMTVTAPFKEMFRQRDKSVNYEASVQYGEDKQAVTQPVSLELRGNFRLQRAFCSWPPLKFRFPPATTDNTIFTGQEKLKFVTQCRLRPNYQSWLLREYALYRMYNELTEASFKVRLVEVTYQDSETNGVSTGYGFFIEDIDRLAERLGGEHINEAPGVPLYDPHQLSQLALFQFAIGNVDWAVKEDPGVDCCHNIKIIRKGATHLPVPYDFDMTGFVNAKYATTHPAFKMRSIKDRRYRGFCEADAIGLATAMQSLAQHRQRLVEIIRETPGLSVRDANKAITYLGRYYKLSQSEGKLRHQVLNRCRGPVQ